MHITFWGVRGSIPTPGPSTMQVGGNTSCVEVRAGKAILIFDGGTGLRLLGKKLLPEMPITAHMFFSHVHWDHIQGFPFFEPAFVPGNVFHLYGGNNVSRTLGETLAGQMDHPNFPVSLTVDGREDDVPRPERRRERRSGRRRRREGRDHQRARQPPAGGLRLSRRARRQGVRLRDGHRALRRPHGRQAARPGSRRRRPRLRLAVHPEEYGAKKGWGHSTFEEGARIAKAAGARQLVLFHHDPMQNDAAVREKEKRARALFPNAVAAHEGLSIDV